MRWGCDFIPLSRGTNCIRFSPETRRSAGAPTAIFLRPPHVSAPVDSAQKDLVELKARYEDLGKARALLAGAEHVATVRQVDTYLAWGNGASSFDRSREPGRVSSSNTSGPTSAA